MSATFTSALIRAREVLDRKRGRSNDSAQTDNSPFSSSLATPVDASDIGVTHVGASSSASPAWRFLVSAGEDSSMLDYFGFKKSGAAILSRALDLRTRSSSSVEQTPSTSRCTSTQISPGCSTRYCQIICLRADFSQQSIYNLPNGPIEVRAQRLKWSASGDGYAYNILDDIGSYDSSIWDDEWEGLSPEARLVVTEDITLDSSLDRQWVFTDKDDGHPLWFLQSANVSLEDLIPSVAKVVCFIPWCISVGGAMLLWPDQLEVIAFQAGYVDPVHGIRRFAHWADVGLHFVMIFFAFLATVLWFLPRAVGVTLVIGLCSRFILVWRGYKMDYSVPLGEDDRQSLYLLATVEESTITKTDAGFIAIPSEF